jgi:5-methyltetrahydropteroyltriglutamate--homocysteine methyltransferase
MEWHLPHVGELADFQCLPSDSFPIPAMVKSDCDLKTRKWDEVRPALVNMVATALRKARRGKLAWAIRRLRALK